MSARPLIRIEKEKIRSFSFADLSQAVREQRMRLEPARLEKAYLFASQAHRGQKRLSQEDFIHHPLYVAWLTVQLHLDETSVIAALLHDTVEEGGASLKGIEEEFGLEVALIVDGLTKVRQETRKFVFHQEGVEDFRKLLLASVDDVRVLLIRLCDKLHNGLTVDSLPPQRQKHYAQGIFHLYGPLAEYIGLGFFKRELEDIAFQILYPQQYRQLRKKLRVRKKKRRERVRSLIRALHVLLKKRRIPYLEIYGRDKGLYSIWQKIQRQIKKGKVKKADPAHILDKIGVTVLTEDIASCYAVLGAVHNRWEFLPEEFDDYISRPKPNGYRAIQTTIHYGQETAEIQIKTQQMHEYNEFGPASHIAYKAAGGKSVADFSYLWVKKLVSWQKQKNGVKNFRVRVFDKYVFVATPKGDVIQLEKGSTPLDFAYRIHTLLGDCCQAAKVNGKIVKLSYRLQNGDFVEIIKSPQPLGPKRDWLHLVKMEETKRKIRRGLRLD